MLAKPSLDGVKILISKYIKIDKYIHRKNLKLEEFERKWDMLTRI